MEAIFPHDIQFTNERAVSVSDVANSLLANEQILLNVGRILELCFDGLSVEKTIVTFVSATTNSPLKEAFLAGLLIAYQETLKEEVPKMIEAISGIRVDPQYRTIVTVIFLVVVVYGIEKAWDIFKNSKKGAEKQLVDPRISGNFNTLINIGGDLIGVSPERLASAVERSFVPKQRAHLARTALAFIQPAKRESGATIRGGSALIDADAIAAAPSVLDIALDRDDEDDHTPHEGVEVVIHATDIDHNASGWAGHIPGIWEKRLRMKLFPAIAPTRLFGKDKITADIILVSKRGDDGRLVPYTFHVVSVYD